MEMIKYQYLMQSYFTYEKFKDEKKKLLKAA